MVHGNGTLNMEEEEWHADLTDTTDLRGLDERKTIRAG